MSETGLVTTFLTVDSSQKSFSSVYSLLAYLSLDAQKAPYGILSDCEFPFKISRHYAAKIRKGDWFDPLLLQCLPREEEKHKAEGFSEDPVGDSAATVLPGLIHKYKNRVLLTLSPECSMHCRYCFRKNYNYHEFSRTEQEWVMIWAYIQGHPEISEVILSGGDPLTASNSQLHEVFDCISNIAHIKTVRIHTRIPAISPQRITLNFMRLLTEYQSAGLSIIMVHHINHPRELDKDNMRVFQNIRQAGIIQLNQSVLLKQVNDKAATLIKLSHKLLRCGVMPYYLHQLDKVSGTRHFYVDPQKGKKIISAMSEELQGYGVPRYVEEVPGAACKTPIL